MKKWILIIAVMIVVCIVGIYIFIPNVTTIKSSVIVTTSPKGLQRTLLDKKNIIKWWPGENKNGDSLNLNGYTYHLFDEGITLFPISIENEKDSIHSSLLIIALQGDSTRLEWISKTVSSNNPLTRFTNYLNARKLTKNMNEILQSIKQYYSNPKNIYGYDIQMEHVVDDKLISTSGKCAGFPSIAFIYNLIDKLKNYAAERSTKVTGYPMLNIESLDSSNYLVKVALPLEDIIIGNGDILQKKMLKDGNILVAQTQGGYAKTMDAFNQIKNYANDFNFSFPAIPFYSLITDRTKETDSTKWITKIYYPVD